MLGSQSHFLMTMFWWLFLHVLLAFASTCTGKEIGPQCEPNRVLEQDEMHLYAIEGTETSVLPISRNNTDVRWAVPGKYSKSVTNRYRRLVIPDISQFAGGYAMYRLVKDKETVYTSARVYAHIGSMISNFVLLVSVCTSVCSVCTSTCLVSYNSVSVYD
jgi:hypothetical protein